MNHGVYVLLVRLPRAAELPVGSTTRALPAGYYAYIGRALNSLSGRLARHLRTKEVRHWHVDALLGAGQVVDIQLRFSEDPATECRTAVDVAAWPEATLVPGFGASDCHCSSHLVQFRQRPVVALLAPEVLASLPVMYERLRAHYENHALWERDPFETLIKCILSLRTQDPVTDAAAERLFAVVRTPQRLAVAVPETIAKLIYPVGMYRQKARSIIAISQQLLERFAGQTPAAIADLVTLPGVGRKTANLVRSFAFHLDAICVDTHVHRIANRWGLVRSSVPDETEIELRRILPREYWIETNALLIRHGQRICRPTSPRCDRCFLAGACRYPEVQAAQQFLAAVPGAPSHPSLN